MPGVQASTTFKSDIKSYANRRARVSANSRDTRDRERAAIAGSVSDESIPDYGSARGYAKGARDMRGPSGRTF